MEDFNNAGSPTQVEETNNQTVNLNFSKVFRVFLCIVGVIAIILSIDLYFQDLETYSGQFRFAEETYVGGDAYNYIISAARSSAVMVKSLIWMAFGCSMLILSCLLSIKSKICK